MRLLWQNETQYSHKIQTSEDSTQRVFVAIYARIGSTLTRTTIRKLYRPGFSIRLLVSTIPHRLKWKSTCKTLAIIHILVS